MANLNNDRPLSQLDLRINPIGRGTRRCWRSTMAPNIRCEAGAEGPKGPPCTVSTDCPSCESSIAGHAIGPLLHVARLFLESFFFGREGWFGIHTLSGPPAEDPPRPHRSREPGPNDSTWGRHIPWLTPWTLPQAQAATRLLPIPCRAGGCEQNVRLAVDKPRLQTAFREGSCSWLLVYLTVSMTDWPMHK